MPRKLFRLLAAALIALAIPIQGLAAGSAGICMAAGGHDAGHAHAAMDYGHNHDAATDHDESLAQDEHSSQAHCPPCVSCCAAVVIASTTKIVLPEVRPIAAIAAPQHWIAGVLPDNPDRPPLPL